MGLFGPNTRIGVNIGSSSIKVAEMKKSGRSYSLERFGVAQLPDDAIVNREIIQVTAVVDALKSLSSELKLSGKQIVTSLAGSAVIVKRILVETSSAAELEESIAWEAEQYIPFDMNEVVFDYQVLSKNGPGGKSEVLLAACKKSIVESYVNVIQEAGMKVSAVDVDLFALQNIYELNYPSDVPAMIVDVGAMSLKIVVLNNKQPVFSRDASIGGRQVTNDIQKHMGLSYQDAEMMKIDGNMQGQMPQELFDLINVAVDNIAAEIKRSIDFFNASNSGFQVSYILLTGGSSRLVNLPKFVEGQCGLPCQIMNPFGNITWNSRYFDDSTIDAIYGLAPIAMGLGIRGFSK